MNWKLIFSLSLFGMAMGIATVFFIPSNIEPFCWLAIFLVCSYLIAKTCSNKFFVHGLLVSMVNSVWITAAHIILFDQYIASHASEMQMMANGPMASLSAKTAMLIMGPIIGIISGLVLGLFSVIAAKRRKKRKYLEFEKRVESIKSISLESLKEYDWQEKFFGPRKAVKIEFLRQCAYCLYETPKPKTLIWNNGSGLVQNEIDKLNEDDLGIMLDQLHSFNNIVCENCGRNDQFGFAILKVNDKKHNSFENSEVQSEEFKIHNQILSLSKSSLLLFLLKDGNYIIGEVTDILTHSNKESKTYLLEAYVKSKDIQLIKNFKFIEGHYACENLELSEIKEVKHFLNIESNNEE